MKRIMWLLILGLMPGVADAQSIRIVAPLTRAPYSSYQLTRQYWVVLPQGESHTTATGAQSTSQLNEYGQRWRVVSRTTPIQDSEPTFGDTLAPRHEAYQHPDPSMGPAVMRNPNYTVRRVYRDIVVSSYNSERRQTDSTPWEIRKNHLVRFGDAACNFLPKGTLFRLPDAPAPFNTVVFRVEDETAPKFGNRIDLWLLHVRHAENWGLKRLTVEVLGPPRGEAPR